jgi:hypothetical protein
MIVDAGKDTFGAGYTFGAHRTTHIRVTFVQNVKKVTNRPTLLYSISDTVHSTLLTLPGLFKFTAW